MKGLQSRDVQRKKNKFTPISNNLTQAEKQVLLKGDIFTLIKLTTKSPIAISHFFSPKHKS